MEDKTVKTIDFLRARLLAERSVSRTARQRAHELAKRVAELEKQLKYVSIQRKKAEKATVDVLAILENHGRNDISEEFDSSSDQEEMSSQHGETATHVKPQESEFSSSEVESSRSLSWKSSKNSSSLYHEKKFTEASRRRRSSSFTSTGSSPRRVGKSCRQIRHRDNMSAGDVSQNDDVANGEGVTNHGSEKDMERALEHQAQFIARYEAEEKAQREWEDKFRENNGSTPDSCDPGTHSDVTEEREENKAPPTLNDEITPGSQQSQEPNINTKPLLDPNNCDMDKGTPRHSSPGHVSSPQVYKAEQQTSDKSYEPTPQNPSHQLGSVLEALQQAKLSLKSLEKSPILQNGPSVSTYNRSMEKFPLPFSSARLFRLPIDYEYGPPPPPPPPTTTTTINRANNSLTYDPRLSLTSQHTTPSRGQLGQFVSSPYSESLSSSSASLDDRFHMVPTFPYQLEISPSALDPRLGVGPPTHDPRLGMGARDPRLDLGLGQSGFDPRLEMGPGDRYMSGDSRFQAQPFYGDYMRSNMYK